MAGSEIGRVRQSRRGGMKSLPVGQMDGNTVVMKKTGKVAYTPRGSGVGTKSPLAKSAGVRGGLPVRSKGRATVARNTGKSA